MDTGSGMKILLAEDDGDMRRFLVKALEKAGYVVQAFDNGADYIVVGRPIRDAAEPRAAAEAIQATIAARFGA